MTQNCNGSFSQTMYDRILKSNFCSTDTFYLGVYDAAANFNIGSKTSVLLLERLGMIR